MAFRNRGGGQGQHPTCTPHPILSLGQVTFGDTTDTLRPWGGTPGAGHPQTHPPTEGGLKREFFGGWGVENGTDGWVEGWTHVR